MRLRTRLKRNDRDRNLCSVSRCNDEPTHIDSTHKFDDCNVHWCDRHWQQRCDDIETEHEVRGAA